MKALDADTLFSFFVPFFVCTTIKELPVISCSFFFERTRPAASMRPPCLIYLSNSITRPGMMDTAYLRAIEDLFALSIGWRLLYLFHFRNY